MITVLIRVKHGPEALAATLRALVPAVAAGLIGDAVVLSDKKDEAVAAVADAVGATLIAAEGGSWQPGAEAARREWLLCLDDGDVPQEGWIRVLERFVDLAEPGQGLARMRRRRKGGLVGAALAAIGIFGRSSVRAGDLVHRSVLLNHARPRAPVRLPARIERDPVSG